MSSSVTQDSLEVDGDVRDSNSPFDPDNSRVDLDTDLVGISRITKDLNIVNRYRPKWTCKEAFRESYQNWRDGIFRSFSLDHSQFRPKYTEELNDKQGFILIEVYHLEDTNKLLGFIQFTSNQDGYCVEGHNQIRRNPS
ncbi:unnamed protein product [Alternaria sp. RS040]